MFFNAALVFAANNRFQGQPASQLAGRAIRPVRPLNQPIAVPRISRGTPGSCRSGCQPKLTGTGTTPWEGRAAELLDLPMSTYRRHLAEGVDRLAALLWREEVDARAANGWRLDRF